MSRRFPQRLNASNTLQLPELPDPSTSLGSTIAKLAEKEKARRQNNVGGGKGGGGKETPLSMRIIRFGVYMWAIRLGCLGLGMLFGTAPGLLFSFFHMQDHKRYLLPEWQWHDVEALGASQLLSSKVPMFVRNVTVAAEETIDFILAHASFTSPLKINMKGDNVFASFSGDTPWAARHNVSPPLDYLLYANPSDYKPFRYSHEKKSLSFDQRKQQQCSSSSSSSSSHQQQQYCDRGAHWYLSERIAEPLSNPLLKALAPVFPPFIKSQKHQVQVHLLLASEHALCAPHYELEDNFFMQLTGTKTFTISSPNTLAAYRTFPLLHPSYKQARRENLISPEAIHDALEKSSSNNSSGYFNRFSLSKNSTSALTENTNNTSNSSSTDSSLSSQSVGVWQVTLAPGELLFLPAFYPHSVAMGANSVSLNARVPSLAAKVHDTLAKEWELPYSLKTDTKGIQLASLGHVLKMASYGIVVGSASTQQHSSSYAQHVELLRETLKLRYEDAARDERFPACVLPHHTSVNALCTGENIDEAFEYNRLKKASHKVESALSFDINEPSVRLLLLIDLIDEKLDEVLGEDSSPCNFARFALSCL